MLIDRGGIVTHVIVGDHQKLFCRSGSGARQSWPSAWSASGSPHLHGEPLSRDDLLDLAKLRLDLVAAIGIGRGGRSERLFVAHLCPQRTG